MAYHGISLAEAIREQCEALLLISVGNAAGRPEAARILARCSEELAEAAVQLRCPSLRGV
jgi:hypothetical protein